MNSAEDNKFSPKPFGGKSNLLPPSGASGNKGVSSSGGKLNDKQLANLEYVVRMLSELRLMSHGLDDGTLHYLVEMAYMHGEEELMRIALYEKGNQTSAAKAASAKK